MVTAPFLSLALDILNSVFYPTIYQSTSLIAIATPPKFGESTRRKEKLLASFGRQNPTYSRIWFSGTNITMEKPCLR